jgi:hypothetical protein
MRRIVRDNPPHLRKSAVPSAQILWVRFNGRNDDQSRQANGLVWKCADPIRFRLKLTEEAFKPIRRPEADAESSVELN